MAELKLLKESDIEDLYKVENMINIPKYINCEKILIPSTVLEKHYTDLLTPNNKHTIDRGHHILRTSIFRNSFSLYLYHNTGHKTDQLYVVYKNLSRLEIKEFNESEYSKNVLNKKLFV